VTIVFFVRLFMSGDIADCRLQIADWARLDSFNESKGFIHYVKMWKSMSMQINSTINALPSHTHNDRPTARPNSETRFNYAKNVDAQIDNNAITHSITLQICENKIKFLIPSRGEIRKNSSILSLYLASYSIQSDPNIYYHVLSW
jgi:hypothetical protein